MFGSYLLNNESDSIELSSLIAKSLTPGSMLLFNGDLGSGKTFLCRNIILHIINDNIIVPSPTFNILQVYNIDNYDIYHYDLYRLKCQNEIYGLSFEDACNAQNICLIEWPAIINNLLPKGCIEINLTINQGSQRTCEIIPHNPFAI
ncbi:MAG: tRNA (adenosine(37)-N6)-threonylcarbamoyltransferase complex ATPase subunit type 1 TsaE [Rickettsiaceae bacterium]